MAGHAPRPVVGLALELTDEPEGEKETSQEKSKAKSKAKRRKLVYDEESDEVIAVRKRKRGSRDWFDYSED